MCILWRVKNNQTISTMWSRDDLRCGLSIRQTMPALHREHNKYIHIHVSQKLGDGSTRGKEYAIHSDEQI